MGSGLKTCEVCDKVYSDKQRSCPYPHGRVAEPGNQVDGGWVAAVAVMALVGLVGLGVKSCSNSVDARHQLEEVEAAKQSKAADAENEQKAKELGISFSEYMRVKAGLNGAYAACKVQAEGRAKHDYKSAWEPNFTWSYKKGVISIVGHDLEMQNGFGVYGEVMYFCDWDMDMQAIKSLAVTED